MTTTRRSVLAGAAAVLPATAAVALPLDGDHELRRLWAEYLAHAAECDRAHEAMKPVRDAFDKEMAPFWPVDHSNPNNWYREVWGPRWDKHGLGPLTDAWNETGERVREAIARIHAVRATTPFGFAVKLAALPHDPDAVDHEDAVRSVIADIDALLGGTAFGTAFVAAAGERFDGIGGDDDDEAA